MSVYSIFSGENLSNLDPLNAEEIKRILQEMATPVFEKMNIHSTKNEYVWSSDYNEEGIKKIVRFSYRGTTGHLLIGTNFKFMPMINTKQKIVFKKDKLHLFDSTKKIIDSKKDISLWNEKLFVTSLEKFLHKRIDKIERYFSNTTTIQQNIDIALKQLEDSDESYKTHHPEVNYILPFLHAKLGEKEKAIQLMENHLTVTETAPREILDYLKKL